MTDQPDPITLPTKRTGDDRTVGDLAKQAPEIRRLLIEMSDTCGIAFFRRDGTVAGSCMEPAVIVKIEDGLPTGLCAKHRRTHGDA